jgi:hypothetical protein
VPPFLRPPVEHDRRAPARLGGHEAELRLVGQHVLPQRPPLGGLGDGLGVPGPLEPLVEVLEDDAAGHPGALDVAQHRRVHRARLGLGVVALVAAEWAVVGVSEPAGHAELGDHHRLAGMVGAHVAQVGGVRVGGGAQVGLQAQEVRVVRIGMVGGEEASGPGRRGAQVHRVHGHEVLGGQRLVRVAERVVGQPVGEGQRAAPAAGGLERGQAVQPGGDPGLHRRGFRRGRDVAALVGRRARVEPVGRPDGPRVPLDPGRPGEQPARDVGTVGAARVPGAGREVGVAVHDGHGVGQLGVEAARDRRVVGVAGGQ